MKAGSWEGVTDWAPPLSAVTSALAVEVNTGGEKAAMAYPAIAPSTRCASRRGVKRRTRARISYGSMAAAPSSCVLDRPSLESAKPGQ